MGTPPSPPPGLHATPIAQRPKPSLGLKLRAIVFNLGFFAAALVIHLSQLLLLPLAVLPGDERRTFRAGLSFTKDAVEGVLRAVNQFGGPSRLLLSSDGTVSIDEVGQVDREGRLVGLSLAKHSVWISNHSQYQDWLVIWLLMSAGHIAQGLCIIMKASLMWVPIIGPIMQSFYFDFISKTRPIQRPDSGMLKTARRSAAHGSPFALLLFPEGTLLSKLTQPKSTEYAHKIGARVPENLLLPRATGLLYALRSLGRINPEVVLYDLTIGYPGMHVGAYSQDYYSLQTVYGYGQSAPQIRLHLQQLKLNEIPLGLPADLTELEGVSTEELEASCTDEDRKKFDAWIYDRWEKKDALMRTFYETGRFVQTEDVELDVRFRAADGAVLVALVAGVAVALKAVALAWAHGLFGPRGAALAAAGWGAWALLK